MIEPVAHQILTIAPGETGRAQWVAKAACARGLAVANVDVKGERYYWGGPGWASRNADSLGVGLLEPPDDWLSELPREHLGRSVRLVSLEDVTWAGPTFVKAPRSKDFPARVYDGASDLRSETAHLPPDTPVLISEVVEFAAEYRLFVLDGRVHTGSRYASWGHLDPGTLLSRDATTVVSEVEAMLTSRASDLPSAVVIDAGLTGPGNDPRRDVAIVEANMAWFAQPYWSDPDRVLDVVMRSAGPRGLVSETDRPFIRESEPP